MTALSNEIKQVRMGFIQEKFEEIKTSAESDNFYSNAFYVFAKLGLQQIAKQEQMLNREEYSDLEAKEVLLEKIREFLTRHIK